MRRAFTLREGPRPREFFACLLLIAASATISPARAAATDAASLRPRALDVFAPLPAKMPGGEDDTRAMVKLGHDLYFDKCLSVNKSISCNSCHALDTGGSYIHATSPGAFGKNGERNSPTVLNAGFQFAQFWDGRAASLEAQAREPMLNPDEMGMPAEAELLKRLREMKHYRAAFALAFPGSAEPVTIENLTKAIAAFERTLITHDRFDKFLKGSDRALSRAELKGLALFLDTGCAKCHTGPGLGGNSFQKIGVTHPYANTNDIGRAKITGNEADRFKFKVPSLRNVALTPPYFHDGQAATLVEAVRQMADLQFGKELTRPEAESIETFLHSLSDDHRARRPRSGLPAQQ
jgi:cytochrome c peroxidase